MIDQKRYEMELAVLKRKLPEGTYHFSLGDERPFVAFAARTNVGNLYTIQVELERFPANIPKAFVTKMLRDKDGNPLDHGSRSMHTLASERGWTRICHYGSDSWTPAVSLYKIYIKCRLWLEVYEKHLQSGEPMDHYLKHQA